MFILWIAFTVMGSCLNLLLCSSTDKSEESTLLSFILCFLMWLVSCFWKQQLVIYVDYCSPSWFGGAGDVLVFSSAALSVPLLPRHWAGWRPLLEWEWGHPVSEMLDVIPPPYHFSYYLSLTSRTFVIILWTSNNWRDVCMLTSFPPMVCRHRSLANRVATALSCSNNIEFGTRIIYCLMHLCKKASLELFSKGPVAVSLQCCSPITFRMLK